MAKLVQIDAGSPEAAPQSAKELKAAIKEANAKVEEIRAQRIKIRETSSRTVAREKLAKTDEDFVSAIEALNEAERALGRFLRTTEGQHVSVKGAKAGEGAGG